jgi:hypothetical protein
MSLAAPRDEAMETIGKKVCQNCQQTCIRLYDFDTYVRHAVKKGTLSAHCKFCRSIRDGLENRKFRLDAPNDADIEELRKYFGLLLSGSKLDQAGEYEIHLRPYYSSSGALYIEIWEKNSSTPVHARINWVAKCGAYPELSNALWGTNRHRGPRHPTGHSP